MVIVLDLSKLAKTYTSIYMIVQLLYSTSKYIVCALSPSACNATQLARSPKNVNKPKLDVIVIVMVYFSSKCLLKLILYNRKPQIKCVTENQKCFCFVSQKS